MLGCQGININFIRRKRDEGNQQDDGIWLLLNMANKQDNAESEPGRNREKCKLIEMKLQQHRSKQKSLWVRILDLTPRVVALAPRRLFSDSLRAKESSLIRARSLWVIILRERSSLSSRLNLKEIDVFNITNWWNGNFLKGIKIYLIDVMESEFPIRQRLSLYWCWKGLETGEE